MDVLSFTTSGLTFRVGFDRWDAFQPNRARWAWAIVDDSATVLAEGDDLTTVPLDGAPMYAEALGALLTFLSACIESGPDGESGSTFPPAVHDLNLSPDVVTSWAYDIEGVR